MHTRRDDCFTIMTDQDLHDHQFTAAHYHGNSHLDFTLPLSRHDRRSQNTARGRMLRYVEDICDLGKLNVRWFKDHPLQHELNDKLTRAPGWRLWLPTDYPAEFAAELTAEKYDQSTDEWIHNAQKFGPNDWRDTTKYLVLWLLEHLNPLLLANGIPPATPPPPDDPDHPTPHSRDYILKPSGNE
jgi:hypothetical protein